ncbi:hypothetical protein C7M30_02213 [Bacillus subtilis]|nr:hypothetical protein C7M30_02213 [Bacillus subtilis]CAF1824037.1 hypothetical protein NRS6131_02472 [Bacillus subtilis]CAI6330921.1 hypothetical protein NRS6131_21950 [Bacillus subtilis]
MGQAKRVNVISLKLVKESSLLYKERSVKSPEDGYQLIKVFLVIKTVSTSLLLLLIQKINQFQLLFVTLVA